MKTALLVCLGLFNVVSAFIPKLPNKRSNQIMMRGVDQDADAYCRKEILAGLSTLGLIAGGLTLVPQNAKAEFTLAQRKVQYFRYAPRIKSARDYFAGDFKKAIDSKNWKAMSESFKIEGQAPDSSMRNNPQRYINRWEKDLFSPMRVYSQSFSEKGASRKLAALLKAEWEMEEAMKRLERVAKGELGLPKPEGGGLFGFGGGGEAPVDPYAGKSQADLAQALYADAKTAFNDYVGIVNKSIGLELNPIDPIK